MLKIEWDENLCCHAGICVTSLPEVFRVEAGRLQIDPEAAEDQEILAVVARCPSGALQAREISE
ncbi:(4Fe-4S)-binding protein [Methylothermus subterraneus]